MAARLMQNQLYLGNCNCNSQNHPAAFAKLATSFSESPTSSSATLLPGALFGAASVRNPIRSIKPVSFVAEPSRRPRSRYDDTSIVANVPRSSTLLLVGRRGRFSKMEGVGSVQGEVDGSRRVPVVKATKVVIMVDPVEAKRLAVAEMKAIQARAKLKRQMEIEAVNGGWAMVGLTAGIVIDGYTGKSILVQIAGYLDAAADFLTPLTSSS